MEVLLMRESTPPIMAFVGLAGDVKRRPLSSVLTVGGAIRFMASALLLYVRCRLRFRWQILTSIGAPFAVAIFR